MLLNVEYCENIVAGVIFEGGWRWYVTYRDDWFLDWVKWGQAFGGNADELARPENHKGRYWIPIVNEHTAGAFLKAIERYRVTTEELSQIILEDFLTSPDWKDDSLAWPPMLIVNFDQKWLKTYFPEPSGLFDKYVPDGWVGEYADCLDDVPVAQRYWVVNGRDLFAKELFTTSPPV